ncbi:hypothetical protein AX660_22485 [Paraglaciecola hydrolytica]|uniref:Transposase n=1 Tax=Paraglaciecola hydrolytica TaxID=1799789 RepID=A0A148KMG4_9ALTE|nr:hypothetical protein AX660_22485 [Paraglaciecola hydrolytica]
MQEWQYPFKSVQRRSKLPRKRRAGGFKSVLYRVKCFRFSPLDLQAFALSKTDLIPTESCIYRLLGYIPKQPVDAEL